MDKRVVVTGIGLVSPFGTNKEVFFEKLLNKESIIKEIPENYEENYKFKSRYFVPCEDFNLEDFSYKKLLNRAMGNCSKLAIIASKKAIEDAGLKGECLENSCIIIGNGISNVKEVIPSYLNQSEGRKERFKKMLVPIIMPNSASSWISILNNIQGENHTVNAACASGNVAIGSAFKKIKNGEYKQAICGGVEFLKDDTGTSMRAFDVLGTLTKTENSQSFSKDRSGFLFSEGGAGILILEELESAKSRGARIYAEILDYKANSDAYNIFQLEPSGKNIKKILKEISKDYKIDYINAHGTGTIINDEIESSAIKEIFGNKPLVNSSKNLLGHGIGASAGLEAIITSLSIYKNKIHGMNIKNPIEGINLAIESQNFDINYAISSSYAFGGHNTALLFGKYYE